MRSSFRPAIFAAIVALAACAAPTLPTPPPSETTVLLLGDEAVVTGIADPNALVACLNENSGKGVIETADSEGVFEIRIAAEEADHLTLWQVSGGAPGQLLELTVPAASP